MSPEVNTEVSSSGTTVFLGLGSNLGNRTDMLSRARHLLASRILTGMEASPIYQSPPHGGMEQPWYLNQVLRGTTRLAPEKLLSSCLEVEEHLGRIREKRWDSRTIDIDILYFGDQIIKAENLAVPHSDLHNRGFFLLPLSDLDSNWQDPVADVPVSVLLARWGYVFSRKNAESLLPTIYQDDGSEEAHSNSNIDVNV